MMHAMPDSIVGKMFKYGHFQHGTIEQLPDDRMCECGAWPETEEANKICPKATYVSREVMNREINALVKTFGHGTSGRKLSKKVNKLYKREMQSVVERKADELYKDFEEHIKPCPKWIPKGWWRAWGSIFIEGLE